MMRLRTKANTSEHFASEIESLNTKSFESQDISGTLNSSLWNERVRSKYRICSGWLKNSTEQSDAVRKEVDDLLKDNRFGEYKYVYYLDCKLY